MHSCRADPCTSWLSGVHACKGCYTLQVQGLLVHYHNLQMLLLQQSLQQLSHAGLAAAWVATQNQQPAWHVLCLWRWVLLLLLLLGGRPGCG